MNLTENFNIIKQKNNEVINSLMLKRSLNNNIWEVKDNSVKLYDDVRNKALYITKFIVNKLNFELKVTDILLVGSLCGHGWSKYSDFDLHIVTNNVIDPTISEDFFKLIKNSLNDEYNFKIKGFDVEISFQKDAFDIESSSIYSIYKNEWLRSEKTTYNIVDLQEIERLGNAIITAYNDFIDNTDLSDAKKVKNIKTIAKNIKEMRQEGLDSELKEQSVGNLVFKYLRRLDFIKQLKDKQKEIISKVLSL